MGNFDRKSLLLLTGGCAVAAFGVWLGSIAGGFWALALVGLSVSGVVALGLRGLLRRLSGLTLMVDGILLVGVVAFASGVGPWRWPLAVVLSLLCVCLLAVVVRPRSAGCGLRRELRVGLELDLAFMAITLYAFYCSDFQPGHWLPLWLVALDVLFFASDIARWRLDRPARI